MRRPHVEVRRLPAAGAQWAGAALLLLWTAAPSFGDPGQPAAPPVSVPVETGALPAIAGERSPIDLATVIARARNQNLAIVEAHEAIGEQQAVRRGVRAQALPNVGLSAGLARLSPNIATVAGVPAARAWLSIAPGRVFWDARAAKFAVEASE